ncbi:hypothetical protein ACSZMN_20645 [Aeromonas veronii]
MKTNTARTQELHVLSGEIPRSNFYLSHSHRIYSQSLFNGVEKNGAEITFHPSTSSPLHFYSECNQEVLCNLTREQLITIETLISNGAIKPTFLFFKVEARILNEIVPSIIETAKSLRVHNSELIIDVHERLLLSSNRVTDAIHQLSENGVYSCLGGYEWEYEDIRRCHVTSGLYRYIRLANPPMYLNDANRFLDVCFEMVEKFGANIIVDKIQSRSQYELSKKHHIMLLKDIILSAPN